MKADKYRSLYRGCVYLGSLWLFAFACAPYLVYGLQIVLRVLAAIMAIIHAFVAGRTVSLAKLEQKWQQKYFAGSKRPYIVNGFRVLIIAVGIYFAAMPVIQPWIAGCILAGCYLTAMLIRLGLYTQITEKENV